ncbi:hypothetical protein JHK86_045315 [Glycine max]|nr:hypothetical protein JHK86_045315 [Glycine max]
MENYDKEVWKRHEGFLNEDRDSWPRADVATSLSKIQDIIQIFFAVLLWMFLRYPEHGRNDRPFLFSHVINIVTGPKEDRHLLIGLHTVVDVYCGNCREVLGWKYERAYEASQKYKERKCILENSKIVKENQ